MKEDESNNQISLNKVSVVILAGGKGTRLAPYTNILPKPLMPVGDIPILEIILRQLQKAGFKKIILSVGYLASLIEAYFGDGSRWDLEIRYSFEVEPLGTAGPLALIEDLKSTFILMNGDILTTLNYADVVDFHRLHDAFTTVGVYKKQVCIELGVLGIQKDRQIFSYIEKPTINYDVSMGFYVMEPDILKFINKGERFDLPELIKQLIIKKKKVFGYPFKGTWLDIGRQEDYLNAVKMFENDPTVFLKE
jgi:NDP-mannose synthase